MADARIVRGRQIQGGHAMELVVKRTLIMLMLVAAFLVAGMAATGVGTLNLASGTAYAGEDGCDDDEGCESSGGGSGSGSDTGSSPSGGVNTGGGGLAGDSGPSTWPIALGGLGALGAGTLLVRRLASHNG
jgi:hypothetical protein